MINDFLKSCSPIVVISTSSINIRPENGSTMRNSAMVIDDFPRNQNAQNEIY